MLTFLRKKVIKNLTGSWWFLSNITYNIKLESKNCFKIKGRAYIELKFYEKAIDCFNKVIELDKHDYER